MSHVTVFGTPDTSEPALTLETGEAAVIEVNLGNCTGSGVPYQMFSVFSASCWVKLEENRAYSKFRTLSCQDKYELTLLRFRLNSASSARCEH